MLATSSGHRKWNGAVGFCQAPAACQASRVTSSHLAALCAGAQAPERQRLAAPRIHFPFDARNRGPPDARRGSRRHRHGPSPRHHPAVRCSPPRVHSGICALHTSVDAPPPGANMHVLPHGGRIPLWEVCVVSGALIARHFLGMSRLRRTRSGCSASRPRQVRSARPIFSSNNIGGGG